MHMYMEMRVQMGKHRCAWVRTGAHGCVGVHGAWGTHKQGKKGGIYGRAGQDWGTMAGEISPHMMFFGVCQK